MSKISLIVDENISWRIKNKLQSWTLIPVNEIEAPARLNDIAIWTFAKTKSLDILTFDEDFVDLYNIYSHPPKIIWVRTGNLNTQQLANRLHKLENIIQDFLSQEEIGVLEIF